MTQVGRFRASTFVRCKKKALCAPSVLPGPSEGDHLSPNRGELIPVCVVLLFMKDKESRPQRSLFEQSRKLLQHCAPNLSEPIGQSHYGCTCSVTCSQSSGCSQVVRRQRNEVRGFTVGDPKEARLLWICQLNYPVSWLYCWKITSVTVTVFVIFEPCFNNEQSSSVQSKKSS